MKNRIFGLLIGVVLLGGGYLFLTFFERYDTTEDQGWSDVALRNPFLAAQQFLQRLDTNVQSVRSLEMLVNLPFNGVIIVSEDSQIVSKRRSDGLVQWTRQGGHLIVATKVQDSHPNYLLKHFDIEVNRSSGACEEDDASNCKKSETASRELGKKISEYLREEQARIRAEAKRGLVVGDDISVADREAKIDKSALTVLEFGGDENQLRIHFSERTSIDHPSFYEDATDVAYSAIYWRGHQDGIHFVQFDVGDGLLTVIAGDNIWRSGEISLFDHAYLMWLLVARRGDVIILYGSQMPSLWYLVRRYALELLVVGVAWLIAWVIFHGRRFGPLREQQFTVRRSIAEHIGVSASYLWRHHNDQYLLDPVRDSVRHRMQILYRSFDALDRDRQIALVSDHCGIDQNLVSYAWFSKKSNEETNFYKRMRIFQNIRKTL